jgi:hypothetical protein
LKELEKKPQDVPQIVIVERTERPADDTHEKIDDKIEKDEKPIVKPLRPVKRNNQDCQCKCLIF